MPLYLNSPGSTGTNWHMSICHANQWLIRCQSYTNPRTVAQVTGELVYYGDQLLVSTEDDWGHQSVYISNRETTLHISHSADNTNFIGDRLTQVTPIPVQSEDSFASNRGKKCTMGTRLMCLDGGQINKLQQTAHSYDTTTLQLKHKCTASILPIHLTVINANPPSTNRYRLAQARSITTFDWSPIGTEKVNTWTIGG